MDLSEDSRKVIEASCKKIIDETSWIKKRQLQEAIKLEVATILKLINHSKEDND